MPVIYVLHFDTPLAHAQHYAGCTINLKRRLINHARGFGSSLTRELHRLGINWTLGGLYETSRDNMRKHERKLKDQANGKRYCEICSPATAKVPGTKPYAVENVPFPIRSDTIRKEYQAAPITGQTVQIYRTVQQDDNRTAIQMQQIIRLMSADKDALGFIPAGGSQGLKMLVDRGQIVLAQDGAELVGYVALTMNKEKLNIHQCCIRDDYRLLGLGRKMIAHIESQWSGYLLTAKVRNDLAANEFWAAIGFTQVDQWRHKTSGSLINYFNKGENPIEGSPMS